MTSEYMNNLYRDLLSNSPQTVTIPIPSDMGTGQIAQVVTKQGAVVSDWKMNYFSDMNVRGINSEDYIQMLFCLNDGVSWNIAGSREGACLAKGESCISRGHGKMESLCYAQNSDFYFKNIKIPVPYFKRLLQDYFEDGEITVYEKKLLTGISKVSITPYMEHIFAELQDFTHYRGGLGYLFLESKIHAKCWSCESSRRNTAAYQKVNVIASSRQRESLTASLPLRQAVKDWQGRFKSASLNYQGDSP